MVSNVKKNVLKALEPTKVKSVAKVNKSPKKEKSVDS